jgi:hypothetical protein
MRARDGRLYPRGEVAAGCALVICAAVRGSRPAACRIAAYDTGTCAGGDSLGTIRRQGSTVRPNAAAVEEVSPGTGGRHGQPRGRRATKRGPLRSHLSNNRAGPDGPSSAHVTRLSAGGARRHATSSDAGHKIIVVFRHVPSGYSGLDSHAPSASIRGRTGRESARLDGRRAIQADPRRRQTRRRWASGRSSASAVICASAWGTRPPAGLERHGIEGTRANLAQLDGIDPREAPHHRQQRQGREPRVVATSGKRRLISAMST